jgi:hypothetical protein
LLTLIKDTISFLEMQIHFRWMMKKVFYFFIFITWTLFAHEESNYSIAFVHLGMRLPFYMESALKQARLLNPDCPIILIANEIAIKRPSHTLQENNIVLLPCEKIPMTKEHIEFRKTTKMKGLWLYSTERFLVLNDFMQYYDVENVFHLENDNMLYVNLKELLPIFKEHYPGIGATFDNEDRCIAGFMYISNRHSMHALASYMASLAHLGYNDMESIALFKNNSDAQKIDYLPIIPEGYAAAHPLVSSSGHKAKQAQKFSNYIELFGSIFDAAAIGQYLGGIDGYTHGTSEPGFINESCIFNPSYFTYEWIKDEMGRKIPYAIYENRKYRINNLHIHCKNLHLFAS